MNGTDNESTDFNLFVRRGSTASFDEADCTQDARGNYAVCRFDKPAAGDWYARVDQQRPEGGEFQLVVTMLP